MKKVTAGVVLMMFLAFGASAQEKQHADHGKHKAKNHREHITKELNLTDEQKQQLKTIKENHRKQMTELKKNENLTVKEMRERKASLSKQNKAAVEGILTAEQKSKLQEQRAKSMQHRQQMQVQRMEKMRKELALTDDQSSRLKTLNESYKAKFESLKAKESLDQTARREQFKALKKQQKAEFKNVLTQEQIQKLDEMKKDKGGRRHAR
jgi:Spy/CpxP family protein refolding chaperone